MTRQSDTGLYGRPEARTGGLRVEPVGDEMVVYDQRRERVHALDATAYRVWTACDGARTVGQVASETGLALPEVVEIIAALQENMNYEYQVSTTGSTTTTLV